MQMVTIVAFGELPEEVLQALRTGELVALAKGDTDVRPLLIGSTFKRLGLRALVRAKKSSLGQQANTSTE